MTDDLRAFLATIYGEAAQSSVASWKAIASVIMNRVGTLEWKKYKTPLEVIANTGFDAFSHQNAPYVTAWRALALPHMVAERSPMARLMAAVVPIYEGGERTTDAQLYYSPMAQAMLHKKNPRKWPAAPRWRFELLEPVDVPGTEKDDFIFFRYRKGKA